MRTAKSLSNPWSTAALVEELDDTTLKSGHALLDHLRAEEFCQWIDRQLEELEFRFRDYATGGSIRTIAGTIVRWHRPRARRSLHWPVQPPPLASAVT